MCCPCFSWLHHSNLCLHPHRAVFSVSVAKFPSTYEGTSHWIRIYPIQYDLSITWSHLQRPSFHIRSHSQVWALGLECIIWGGTTQPITDALHPTDVPWAPAKCQACAGGWACKAEYADQLSPWGFHMCFFNMLGLWRASWFTLDLSAPRRAGHSLHISLVGKEVLRKGRRKERLLEWEEGEDTGRGYRTSG